MLDPVYYPIHDFGPVMKGLVIGGMGIVHVFLAQFAIGGGILMCVFQAIAMRRSDEPVGRLARRFLDSYFRVLVLISFILGALTGVGMWLTTIQISAPTIGLMVDEFHWLWATEWTFFCLEIFSGYLFYRYAAVLPDRVRMILLLLYAFAAWMSLFWINGILSFQLTPGRWVETGDVWAGFFNPGFLPSLGYRTVVCLTLGALAACVVINTMPALDRAERTTLINLAARLLVPMILMPLFGAWYLATMPDDSRGWVLGGSAAMTLFMNVSAGLTLLIGAYALVGLVRRRLFINGATATLLLALAFGATAGGEFVREGARKPFTVRRTLYSNSIRPAQVAHLRAIGSVTRDPYPIADADDFPDDRLVLGAKVYRFQCSVCHTVRGVNGLVELTRTWSDDQARLNIAKLQQTKAFMPPFAGSPEELDALVQYLRWETQHRPDTPSTTPDATTLDAIARWLDEAGVEPAAAQAEDDR